MGISLHRMLSRQCSENIQRRNVIFWLINFKTKMCRRLRLFQWLFQWRNLFHKHFVTPWDAKSVTTEIVYLGKDVNISVEPSEEFSKPMPSLFHMGKASRVNNIRLFSRKENLAWFNYNSTTKTEHFSRAYPRSINVFIKYSLLNHQLSFFLL